jgi:hypothetical protein
MKGEANHWFLLFLDEAQGASVITVSEWRHANFKKAHAFSCGERCSHTLISRWFETRSFDAPTARNVPFFSSTTDASETK